MTASHSTWQILPQPPIVKYRHDPHGVARSMSCASCSGALLAEVDEQGHIWEWCGVCRVDSMVTVARPQGFRRYDQRDRLEEEIGRGVSRAKQPAIRVLEGRGHGPGIRLGKRDPNPSTFRQ